MGAELFSQFIELDWVFDVELGVDSALSHSKFGLRLLSVDFSILDVIRS
jgi:hypothetical protein